MKAILYLINLTRWSDWITTLLILVAAYFISIHPASAYTDLIFLFLSFSLSFSFGFAINDYFDAPYDKMKPVVRNVISSGLISKLHAAAFCITLLASCIIIGYYFLSPMAFIFLLVLCVLFSIYSSPPFRMKERAYAGIINHGMFYPVLFMAGYTANMPIGSEAVVFSISTFMLSLLVDVTQEIRDMEADKKSGFMTTALKIGYNRSVTLLKILTALAMAFFVAGVVLYRPMYIILVGLGIIFYIRVLVSSPPRSKIFEKSIDAWNKGVALSFLIGLFLLFYFYL